MAMKAAAHLVLAATLVASSGCSICRDLGRATVQTCDNLCTLFCGSSSGIADARIGGRDLDGSLVHGKSEWHKVKHPKIPVRAVNQLTLVFREGELVVRLLLDPTLWPYREPDTVLTFVVPDGGSADAGDLLLAEIVAPKTTARITGGKLVMTRHTEAKIEGELDLDLSDGGFVRSSFVAKSNYHLNDPEFKGGGGGGD